MGHEAVLAMGAISRGVFWAVWEGRVLALLSGGCLHCISALSHPLPPPKTTCLPKIKKGIFSRIIEVSLEG